MTCDRCTPDERGEYPSTHWADFHGYTEFGLERDADGFFLSAERNDDGDSHYVFVSIEHCPWCGEELTKEVRDD